MRLSNIWENFDLLLSDYFKNNKSGYQIITNEYFDKDFNFIGKYEDLLEMLLNDFQHQPAFVGTFEYSELESKAIIELIKSNIYVVIKQLMIDLADQNFKGNIWGVETFEEPEEWFINTIKQKITEKLGPEKRNASSADWGGMPVWDVKGDGFNGTFVVIDDNHDVVLMTKYFDEITEEDNITELQTENDYVGLEDLLNKAVEIKLLPTNIFNGHKVGISDDTYIGDESWNISQEEDEFTIAADKLSEKYTERVSGGADWSVRTWEVKEGEGDLVSYFVCDDESGNLEFLQRVLHETDENEYNVIASFEYSDIDELFKFIDNYEYPVTEVEEENDIDKITTLFKNHLPDCNVNLTSADIKKSENSVFFKIICYSYQNESKNIVQLLKLIDIKPLSLTKKRDGNGNTRQEFTLEIDFSNPKGIVSDNIKNLPKIKYTAIDKKTYDTDKSGLDFEIEINGIKAKGTWKPTGQYCPGGVDIDELYLNDNRFNRVSIFEGGGGNRHYEMYGAPEKLEKQPKDLRFTGEYYSTLNLGTTFKNKIIEALKGNNKNTNLSQEFLNIFKIKN